MSLSPGNTVSDKMQYPIGAGGGAGSNNGGGDILNLTHQRQWFPDERDGFISWLRSEFAAANAIIDTLCQHLKSIGEPGEYDAVMGFIQQRRCNWNVVLHMQQYFSISEVIYSLQQVAWRRQQRFPEPVKRTGKEFRRSGGAGSRHGQRGGDFVKGNQNYSGEYHSYDGNGTGNSEVLEKVEEITEEGEEAANLDQKNIILSDDKKDVVVKPQLVESFIESSNNSKGTSSGTSEEETEQQDHGSSVDHEGHCDIVSPNHVQTTSDSHGKLNRDLVPRTFVATELLDGKMVNMMEGMKLYEEFLNVIEVSKIVSLVTDIRAAGRKGNLQGQTYVAMRRPMKGHGREMIQLGLPIADAPFEDENVPGNSAKDSRVESIPSILQDVIDCLADMQITSVKADSCIIDIFNEGDYSQPSMWPSWYGRPICLLFLTECDMSFGRMITIDHPGDFRGSFRQSFTPGSVLSMQGRSADIARHAMSSTRKHRILITMVKSQPRKPTGDIHHQPPYWGPPPSRSPNLHPSHRHSQKHYMSGPASGVLPVPLNRPPPSGVPPIFVSTPVASAIPFPATVAMSPISAVWPPQSSSSSSPRHPPTPHPHLHVPGTGVFLPPSGSGNNSSEDQQNGGTTQSSPKGKANGKVQAKECNGNGDGTTTDAEGEPDKAGTI